MGLLLSLGAGGVAQAAAATSAPSPVTPPAMVPDTMAQRLLACAACHGREGRAGSDGYLPRIAGKPAGYLYNQLLNFREGRRHNAAMANFVDPLTDGYLKQIADHFAALDLPYAAPPPAVLSADDKARGEQLALRGDPARQLPACAQCHGGRLTGMQPATPGLVGLSRDYLLGQLGAWRTQARRAMAPDCMALVANRLSAQELGAVAAWLSAQAVPADSHPATLAPDQPSPSLRCGSAVN